MIRRKTNRSEIQDNIVQELKVDGNITRVCKSLGVCMGTYYNWRHDDPYFNAECDEAIAMGRGW